MHRILLLLLLASSTFLQAQIQFYDTSINLGTIAQGAKIGFNIHIYNPDSTTVTCKLSHICGCTEFAKTKYILGPKESTEIPIIYHSSGNAGNINRGFYVEYLQNDSAIKQKIHFTAFIDTIHPFTTPVLDTFFCYRFDRTTIDNGKVIEGPHQRFVYTLYNCSKKPLVISNVQSSCGCVTPKWPREPIKPGETAEIIAEYNTNGRPGYSQKNLVVTFENRATVVLTLICNVRISE